MLLSMSAKCSEKSTELRRTWQPRCWKKLIPWSPTVRALARTVFCGSRTQRQWKIFIRRSNASARSLAGQTIRRLKSSVGKNDLVAIAVEHLKFNAPVNTLGQAHDNIGAPFRQFRIQLINVDRKSVVQG